MLLCCVAQACIIVRLPRYSFWCSLLVSIPIDYLFTGAFPFVIIADYSLHSTICLLTTNCSRIVIHLTLLILIIVDSSSTCFLLTVIIPVTNWNWWHCLLMTIPIPNYSIYWRWRVVFPRYCVDWNWCGRQTPFWPVLCMRMALYSQLLFRCVLLLLVFYSLFIVKPFPLLLFTPSVVIVMTTFICCSWPHYWWWWWWWRITGDNCNLLFILCWYIVVLMVGGVGQAFQLWWWPDYS